ncbi:preprotein translocase subunit Sec61beta [Nanoarchaeota archaeon]
MGKDDKIRMPSGIGGITRYFDEYKSKFEFAPGLVIVLCIVVMIIVIILHFFGSSLLGI